MDDKTKIQPAPIASRCEGTALPAESAKQAPRGRPFAKGTSGNPAGRPRGACNKATLLAQSLLAARGGRLIERLLTLHTRRTLAELSDRRGGDDTQSRHELIALLNLRNRKRSLAVRVQNLWDRRFARSRDPASDPN